MQRDAGLPLAHPINVHTLTTHLRRCGKTRRLLAQRPTAYRRFERAQANPLWQGDALVGPWLPDPSQPGKQRRAHLFCCIDDVEAFDHSRLVPYAEFFYNEALPRMERVLKIAILRRGLPQALYVDNGQVYADAQFGAGGAELGIRRIHTAPCSPESNGIAERFVRSLKEWLRDKSWQDDLELAALLDQFLAEYNERPHPGLPIAGLCPDEFANRIWLY